MKKNSKIIQLSLIFSGLLLIAVTYLIYPYIKKEQIPDKILVEDKKILSEKTINSFENVEYKGLYNINTPFSVQSTNAEIKKGEPDILYMQNMKVTLKMEGGRTVIITSDMGSYNKVTYDCLFENNVRASDGETVVLSDNLDLIATEETATVYNNVILTNEDGSLVADKVNYDFEKKHYKVSMFIDKKVKIKLFK